MTITVKLNDLQLVLLSAAAQRDDGSLLPLPEQLVDQSARIRKVIQPLIKRGLVEQGLTGDDSKVWHQEGEERFALFITQSGRAFLGLSGKPASVTDAAIPSPLASSRSTNRKSELVLGMLREEEGASLAELVSATGWLPHSARAALTGLRKKGHIITLDKSGERSCYRLLESAAA